MENKLLTDRDEIMHVPFLIKGRLIDAPQIDRLEIEKAFVGKDIGETYAKLPAAQVICENHRPPDDEIHQRIPLSGHAASESGRPA